MVGFKKKINRKISNDHPFWQNEQHVIKLLSFSYGIHLKTYISSTGKLVKQEARKQDVY